MHYKTIVHELLEQNPQLHEDLRRRRRVLATIESCARDLKDSHERWTETLSQGSPQGNAAQIASQALDMAIQELQERLQSASPANDESLSLDAAMAFIRNPKSRG